MATGRAFQPEEDRPRAPHPAVVISHSLWRRAFGADRAVLGRSVRIYDRMFTVVWVAPSGFRGLTLDSGAPPELWVPVGWLDEFEWRRVPKRSYLDWPDARVALVVGRIRPGVTLAAAHFENRLRIQRRSPAWEIHNTQSAIRNPQSVPPVGELTKKMQHPPTPGVPS